MEPEVEKNQKEVDVTFGLTVQSAEEGPGCCSPPNVGDSIHLHLPNSDPEDLQFSICKSLLQIPQKHWTKIQDGFIDSVTQAYVSDFVMDLLQALSQSILTVLLPQLHRHRTANGAVSTGTQLTEDQVATYMGNSVRQALAMSFNKETIDYSRDFSQLLTKTITKTVNNVLNVFTRAPLHNNALPVCFVPGTGGTVFDLTLLSREASAILMSGNSLAEDDVPIQPPRDVFEVEEYCVLKCLKEKHARDFLIAYLTRFVNSLRISCHIPLRKCDSNSDCPEDICLIIGLSSEILTVDRESNAEVVPVKNDETQIVEIQPSSSGTVPMQNNCRVMNTVEVKAIEQIAEDLLNAFWTTTEEELDQIYKDKQAHRMLKTRLTQQIFGIVMGRFSGQVPVIPAAGLRMCPLGKFRSAHFNDPGLVAHCVYFKTKEMITRAVKLVLNWVGWNIGLEVIGASSESPIQVPEGPHLDDSPGGGDHPDEFLEEDVDEYSDEDDDEDLDEDEESDDGGADEAEVEEQQPPPRQHSVLLTQMTKASFMALITGEILTLIGIREVRKMQLLMGKMVFELDLDELVKEPYDATVMGRSYRDISHGAIRGLLDEYGSVSALHEAVSERDSSFVEALKDVIKNQLRIPAANIEDQETLGNEHTEDELVQSSCWDRLVSLLRGACTSCCVPPPS